VISKTYDYQADGRLRFSGDLLDHRFDRSYSYDQANRISEALSGAEARGEPSTSNRPYNQAYQYDAWDHLVGRGSNSLWPPFGDSSGRLWSGPGSSFTPNPQEYVNDRNQSWQYDADGHLINSGEVQYTMDAAGAVTHSVSARDDLVQSYGGDGQSAKKVETVTIDDGGTLITTTSVTYFVRSSISGKVISEVDQNGQKRRGYVYAGGQVLASQEQIDASQTVKWEHRDASNASYRRTDSLGAIDATQMAELDPLGNNAGLSNPYVLPRSPAKLWFGGSYPSFGDNSGSGGTQCLVDSIERPCGEAVHLVRTRTADIDPTKTSPTDAGGIGATPIYGRFCVTVTVGGQTQTTCTNEITGYTTPTSLAATIDARLLVPQKTDDEDAANTVANAVDKALQVLKNGCWRDQWNQDVKPANRYFANVQNAEKYTGNWTSVSSTHNKGAKESPAIIDFGIHPKSDTARAMLPPNIELSNYSLVLKYYPGEGMAVTANTDSIEHLIAAGGFTSGLDTNVNVKFAQQFLASAPKCKD